MSYVDLVYKKDEHVATITLNRPDVLNALSHNLMQELSSALDEVQADKEVRCLIITGAGDRAFSVGFDLDGNQVDMRTDTVRDMLKGNYDILLKIWNLRIPVISAVNGYAVAAGSNLSMIADVTIAAESAKFGEPELRHYALSPLLLLPWFSANRKMIHYLYYSGDTISAAQAYEYGMVAKVVPDADLLETANRMATRISMVAPYAVEMTKDSLRANYEQMGFLNAMRYHRANDTLTIGSHGFEEKDRFFDFIAKGDMRGFLEMRDGPFKSAPSV
jgi:enoyl-CoA hydratase/carnithine racemase